MEREKVIDKIGNIGKIFRPNQSQQANAKAPSKDLGSDTVSISQEALKAQEAAKASNFVKNTSDVRQERIKEVKEKLARGDYDNIDNEVLDKVADKIAQALTRS